MRWIIWYLKSCFCDHSWEYSEIAAEQQYMIQVTSEKYEDKKIRSSIRCTKCGHHKSYWKYGYYAAIEQPSTH